MCWAEQIVFLSAYVVRGDSEACSSDTQPKILSDLTGTFTSPDFPSNYPDSVDCRWLIVAQPDQVGHVASRDCGTAFETYRCDSLLPCEIV